MATKSGFLTKLDDIFLQESTHSLSGLYQFFWPKQLKTRWSLPFLGVAVAQNVDEFHKTAYSQQLGKMTGLRKLSNMTDSVLGSHPDDNMVVNPYIKAMNDHSSAKAKRRASKIEREMNHPMFMPDSVKGDLVFALHDLSR